MRVMGIDPGGAVTGYGIVDGEPQGPLHCVICGCVRTRSGSAFEQRLKMIYEEIAGMIGRHHPQQIVFEEIFVSRNVRAALQLGQARGAALMAAVHADLPIFYYAAREVKQALTGYGAAGKEQVQSMVSGLLQLNLAGWPLDTSDALALAICHHHRTASSFRLQGDTR